MEEKKKKKKKNCKYIIQIVEENGGKKKIQSLFVQKYEFQCVVGRLGASIADTSTYSRFI